MYTCSTKGYNILAAIMDGSCICIILMNLYVKSNAVMQKYCILSGIHLHCIVVGSVHNGTLTTSCYLTYTLHIHFLVTYNIVLKDTQHVSIALKSPLN